MHIFKKIKFISYFKLSLLSCVYNYQNNYRFINYNVFELSRICNYEKNL